MKKILISLTTLLLTLSFAQPQGGPNPEIRAMMEPYINLLSSVGLMLELEKTSELPISVAQAELLLPILNELETSAGYDSERAMELLDMMELEILSIEQLTWMDGEFIKRQEQAQNGGGRGGFFGGGRPQGQADRGEGGQAEGGQGRGQQGAQGQRQGGPGGFFQRLSAGEPINMFVENEGAGAVLDELIELLSAKGQ